MGPSKNPTKAEREWMSRAREFGCIVCWLQFDQYRTAVIHHIIDGNKRMGHMFTIGLCEPGHHQQGWQIGMVSVHPWRKQFEVTYGTQLFLLETLREKLGVPA